MKHVLAIGGNDPSGGAGITIDLKTIADFDCYGLHALTAVVAQSTDGVRRWDAARLRDQLAAIFETVRVDVVKIGMLGTAENLRIAIATIPVETAIVLDPVMSATTGSTLSNDVYEDIEPIVERLTTITPNILELHALTGVCINSRFDAAAAGMLLAETLQTHVLVKVGHLSDQRKAIDILASPNDTIDLQPLPWLAVSARGTGCRLSTAIACEIAKGLSLIDAIESARDYLHQKLANNLYDLGSGDPVIL